MSAGPCLAHIVTDRRTRIILVVLALLFLLALHVGYRWVGYQSLPRHYDRPSGRTTETRPPPGPLSGPAGPGTEQPPPAAGSR